jgi:hypothetical protein
MPGERDRGLDLSSSLARRPRPVEAEQGPLAGDLGVECLGPEGADRLPAAPPRRDESRGPQSTEMPAHERLRQADVLDQVGHGRRTLGQPLDDAQPVDVSERLVEAPQVAQVVGLVDDRRQR